MGIMLTCLAITASFTAVKTDNFQMKNYDNFFITCIAQNIVGTSLKHLTEAVLMSTYNFCFEPK